MLCAPAYSSSSSPMYLIKYLLNQQGIQSYNRRGKKSTYSSSSSIRRSYPSFSSSMSPKMSGAPPPREYDERLTPCFEPRCPDLRQRRARRRKFMINWRNENKLKTAEHFQIYLAARCTLERKSTAPFRFTRRLSLFSPRAERLGI